MDIKELLVKYDFELFKMGINPKKNDGYCGQVGLVGLEDQSFQLSHAKWMVQKLSDNLDKWNDQKIENWLGFIQGILWCTKLRGLIELQNENRDLHG